MLPDTRQARRLLALRTLGGSNRAERRRNMKAARIAGDRNRRKKRR